MVWLPDALCVLILALSLASISGYRQIRLNYGAVAFLLSVPIIFDTGTYAFGLKLGACVISLTVLMFLLARSASSNSTKV